MGLSKKIVFFLLISINLSAHEFTECDTNGFVDIYPCKNIDLLHRVHLNQMGGNSSTQGSDIWGWTDSLTGKEYAIITLNSGTSFVDISEPTSPIVVGHLATVTTPSTWRDVKTYQNHAYIVSEASDHGMQVFDLKQLRDATNTPIVFFATTVYQEFGNAHNIVINEDSGFAYAVGSNTCNGGLHMINLQNPDQPTNAGCFSADGYTHDAQCVIYHGSDKSHLGKELCFNANEDTITIVDVSDKNAPVQLSRTSYNNSQYTHQGWLTENHRYFLMNDELDEQNLGHKTKTYIWDMLDIDAPQLIGFYNGPKDSIDHNLYVKGNLAYLTNYSSGLSIVDISDVANVHLQEVANFDSFPANDNTTFNGGWSSYPYFESGNVIMSDFEGGLFILKPNLCPTVATTQGLSALPIGDNSIALKWNLDLNTDESYNIYRSEGGCEIDNFIKIADDITTSSFIDDTVSGQIKIGYKINKFIPSNTSQCQSERSQCVEIQTTGECNAAPVFTGVESVTSSNSSTCGIDVTWQNASSVCSSEFKYDIFRSKDPEFIASESNRIAKDINTNQWHDSTVITDEVYYYLVRAIDTVTNSSDNNVLKIAAKAEGQLTNATWSAGAEIGDGGFDLSSKHVGWEQVATRKNSGQRSYWSTANPTTCSALTTQTIELTAGENSVLSFWTAYDLDFQFDGGVVEVSNVDNQWNNVELTPEYPDQFTLGNNSCDYQAGEKSFTGTDLTWQQHSLDLSDYQGQQVQLRWNYSSDVANNGEGWFIDDISVSNVQTHSQCETSIPSIQPGLWLDRSRSGHGFAIEPIGDNDLYFTVFYTYKDDGTPEWFTSLASIENGVLNIAQDNDTLQQFIYDHLGDPSINGNPSVVDNSNGNNILSIDFNSESVSNNVACNDGTTRGSNLALASWQIGEQQGTWCIEPLFSKEIYPTPDLGGTWWAGNNDSGWGLSLSFINDIIITVLYYYDSEGKPRWALGQTNGFEIGQEITFDLLEFQGFARDATPVETSNTVAGTISLTLNSNTQNLDTDGSMSIDINYQGEEGGTWSRTNLPVTNITWEH